MCTRDSVSSHRDDPLLLHATWGVMEVRKLYSHLMVDGQKKLLTLLKFGFKLFAIRRAQLWGSCWKFQSNSMKHIRHISLDYSKKLNLGISNQKCMCLSTFLSTYNVTVFSVYLCTISLYFFYAGSCMVVLYLPFGMLYINTGSLWECSWESTSANSVLF